MNPFRCAVDRINNPDFSGSEHLSFRLFAQEESAIVLASKLAGRLVGNQINEPVTSCSQMAATDFPKFETEIRGKVTAGMGEMLARLKGAVD